MPRRLLPGRQASVVCFPAPTRRLTARLLLPGSTPLARDQGTRAPPRPRIFLACKIYLIFSLSVMQLTYG